MSQENIKFMRAVYETWNSENWIFFNGGKVLASDGKTVLVDKPAAYDGIQFAADLVTNPDYVGADGANVRFLLAGEDKARRSEPATRGNIVKALTWVSDKAAKNDLVIIGFFGRGAPTGDRTCFFSKGSTVKDRTKELLDVWP